MQVAGGCNLAGPTVLCAANGRVGSKTSQDQLGCQFLGLCDFFTEGFKIHGLGRPIHMFPSQKTWFSPTIWGPSEGVPVNILENCKL